MFDIARDILRELDAGRAVGVVVVTGVFGSAPRAVGSAMAVTADGRAIGSISGGCVEAEAYELARAALATLARYRARFPDGTLAQEAAILAIESHLAQHDRAAAAALARRFLAAHPDSALSQRARSLLARAQP